MKHLAKNIKCHNVSFFLNEAFGKPVYFCKVFVDTNDAEMTHFTLTDHYVLSENPMRMFLTGK